MIDLKLCLTFHYNITGRSQRHGPICSVAGHRTCQDLAYIAPPLLRGVRRSLPKVPIRSVLQSLTSSLVLSRLDYINATLAGIPSYLLQQLQSVMISAARLVFSSSRYNHITPLLHQLHWEHGRGFNSRLLFSCTSVCTWLHLADELEYMHDRFRGS